MQNENNGEKNWKQKLESSEAFPADMWLNKEAAWLKLDSKLKHKPQRQKAMWYWIAAACLLPLLFFLFMGQHRNTSIVVKDIVPTKSILNHSAKETHRPEKERVVVKTTMPLLKKNKLARMPEQNSLATNTKTESITSVITDSASQNRTVVVFSNQNDSNRATTIVPYVAKKLKVVHINELNETADEAPQVVHNKNIHLFPLQIARGEAYGNNVKAIHATSFINFTTKPPSN